MSKLVTISSAEAATMRGATDWARLAAMSDEDVIAAASNDPDALPLTADELARMRRVSPVKILRRRLGFTQVEFSAAFGIPIGTLRDWEQHRTEPEGAALSLIRAISAEPQTMLRLLQQAA
jgi:putative transcriptional regulator